MKISNIYPIANQKHYKNEPFGMILAHLVKDGLYKKENFPKEHYLIMDNGLFEKAQVSTNLQDLIDLAVDSGLPIKEIVIPDAVNDPAKTKELFEANKAIIKKNGTKFRFMFVAQASTNDELIDMIEYINEHGQGLNLSVGISKLSPLDRANPIAIRMYQRCLYPIHFLGIKSSFDELGPVLKWIRSCDTSQHAFIAKNVKKIDEMNLYNYQRDGKDIDLAVDKVDDKMLTKLFKDQQELKARGLL